VLGFIQRCSVFKVPDDEAKLLEWWYLLFCPTKLTLAAPPSKLLQFSPAGSELCHSAFRVSGKLE
jgi:hypothetical protein